MPRPIHPVRRTDSRAVSPVIGVVMMVAITVILTGVIAAFVLGFGAQASAPPQATLALEQNETDYLVITHLSGEPIDLEEVFLRGDADLVGPLATHAPSDADTLLRSGESISIEVPAADGDLSTVVWDIGDDAATLAEHRWHLD